MNHSEKQQLKALVVATAMYYSQDIPDTVLEMFVEDLEDLPFIAVAQALKDVRRDPKTIRCPLPALIRNRIQPAETDENQALAAVSRVISAVSRFGWNNAGQAREYIGELGWSLVQLDGGWMTVCETLNQDNLGTMRAQWRQLAMSQIQRAKSGTINQAPALPVSVMDGLVGLPNFQKLLQEMPKVEV